MVVSVAMLYVKTKKNKALYIKLLCIKPLKKFNTIRFFFFLNTESILKMKQIFQFYIVTKNIKVNSKISSIYFFVQILIT